MLDVFSIVEWVSAGGALGGAAEYLRKLTYEKGLDRALRETLGWPARLASPGLGVRA